MSQNDKPFKIYTASAGSGKTFTIVKEYLALCLGDNADAYREILAVTFTNKAANEMKAKILRFLLGIIDDSQEKDINLMKMFLVEKIGVTEQVIIERCKTLYTKVLHNYSDMSVSTIDSFVQHLSRSFARELDLPSQYSVMLDDDDLIDEIIQLLSDEIGRNKFITKVLSNYVEYNLSEETSWNIKTTIGDFIKKLLKEEAYKKGDKKEIVEIDEEKFNEINKYVHAVAKTIDNHIDNIINELSEKEKTLGITDDDYAGKSRGLPSIVKKMTKRESRVTSNTTEKILSGENDWKNKKSKIVGDEMLYCYRDAVEQYKKSYCKQFIFKKIEKDLYLYVLRNHIFELIRGYIVDSSQVHISEFNKRISDVLGDCSVPFIYERIGEKYKHYFIDEFQDTSMLQWQNFLPLVDNSLAQGNMNLIVGDAKQSIYRFRSGEVEQIINLPNVFNPSQNPFAASCEKQFVNSADKKSLDTNFRSCKNIIKFNNTFFRFAQRYLVNTEIDTNINHVFDDTEQIYTSKDGGLVQVELFSGDLEINDYKEKVFVSMLSKINELRSEGFDYKDITIQVRSNKEGTEIANYLVENGIEVISAESVQIQNSDKVQLIVNTLHYFVNDYNPVTMKSISYFYEKTHRDKKLSLTKENRTFKFEKSVQYDFEKIHNQAYSIYDLCIQLCKYYGFNMLEDVFVQYFLNVVFDWQNSHSAGIDAFMDFWEKKKKNLNIQITGELNAVNIMTIHKSKGLEFKIVMYPFADTMLKTKQGFTQKEIWIQCADDPNTKDIPYLDAFLLPISKTDLEGTDYEYILKREEQKSMLDTLNVMYVSMTRAKERLYIFTSDKVSQSDTSYNVFNDFFSDNLDIQHLKNENDKNSFSDYFLKNDEITVEETEDSKIYTFGDVKPLINKGVSEKKDIDVLELDENEVAPKSLNWFEKLSVEPDPTMIWAEKNTFLPDEWGTLVHEIFSKIKTADDAPRALRRYINDGTLDDEQAQKLIDVFKKMSDIECLKPAFASDAIIMNEMDIHTSNGDVIRPDRYAVTKKGTILIDYKTGKRNEKYQRQLHDYVTALMEMNGNQDIKAYLVYLGEGVEVEQVPVRHFFNN